MNDGYTSILRSISSKSPTPGGGAVAALTLGHSYSLISMVARLTLAREKWIDGHEISNKLLSICEPGINESMALAQNDCDAFDNVMKAYKLSKNSNEDIVIRKEMILKSSLEATNAPYQIALAAMNLFPLLPELAKNGNVNALTDLASASELLYSSIYIASLNVKINIDSITEQEGMKFLNEINHILDKSKNLNENIQKIIFKRLEWH
ncbi:MAG: cyclodeaminase/cyclohydrolase family protein [Candidatus Poseidoniales archaeon]|jgi:formiminotetrahydrofolate cyclodeaminase|tara:strand:+ start:525 stop:1148 length:624 start_codon:yes stop_codon:yes gene_type:complete